MFRDFLWKSVPLERHIPVCLNMCGPPPPRGLRNWESQYIQLTETSKHGVLRDCTIAEADLQPGCEHHYLCTHVSRTIFTLCILGKSKYLHWQDIRQGGSDRASGYYTIYLQNGDLRVPLPKGHTCMKRGTYLHLVNFHILDSKGDLRGPPPKGHTCIKRGTYLNLVKFHIFAYVSFL